jgi:hypothetical protein
MMRLLSVLAAMIAVCIGAGCGSSSNTVYPSSASLNGGPSRTQSEVAIKECSQIAMGSDPSIAACAQGYDDGIVGKPIDQSCASLGPGTGSIGSTSDCAAGWDVAKKIRIPGS